MSADLIVGVSIVSKVEESSEAAFSNIIDFNHKTLLSYLLDLGLEEQQCKHPGPQVPLTLPRKRGAVSLDACRD